jgi:hypothetical protein
MMGSFSLKDIVKVLPEADAYSNEGEAVGDGGSAMIKWLEYTDSKSGQEKKDKIVTELKKYCSSKFDREISLKRKKLRHKCIFKK